MVRNNGYVGLGEKWIEPLGESGGWFGGSFSPYLGLLTQMLMRELCCRLCCPKGDKTFLYRTALYYFYLTFPVL